MPRAKLILALDVDNLKQAKYLVNRLYPKIKIFKVGVQLFTACGPKIIELIRKNGGEVFLDLKFFDIPNTVAKAVAAATRLKVKMLTLHISGGQAMLLAAVKAAKREAKRLRVKPPQLIGVTVLTSQKASGSAVLSLAKQGINCGLDGVVCSVKEAASLRKQIKRKIFIVTPGIRPLGANKNDQQRTATIEEASKAGSDFLVIGRPILEAKDPLAAARAMIKKIS